MQFSGTLNNSILNGAIEAMKLDPSPRNHSTVVEELLKATFICPVKLSKAPLMDENGDPYFAEDCDIQYQMLQNSKGTPFLIAFTDQKELDKWKSRREQESDDYEVVMEFSSYMNLMIRPLPDGKYGPAEGIVINPYGCNLILDRDMVANLIIRRMQMEDLKERNRERRRKRLFGEDTQAPGNGQNDESGSNDAE